MPVSLLTRRRVLITGAAGLSAATLAACGGGGDGAVESPAPSPQRRYSSVQQPFPLSLHTAALADSRHVAVVGGSRGLPVLSSSVDLFEVEQQRWIPVANMTTGRVQPRVVVIDSRHLFVHGGMRSLKNSRTAEWIDLSTGVSQPALASPSRTEHTATRLLDGRILIAGGTSSEGHAGGVSPTLEIWDPTTRNARFSAQPMRLARRGHTATLLPDGRVLLIGGYTSTSMTGSAEIWDPASETSELVLAPLLARAGHAASLLPNGDVLLAGGEQGFLPEPASPGALSLRVQPWRIDVVGPPLPAMESAAVISSSGALLMFGGSDSQGQALGNATQVTSAVQALPSLPSPRLGLSATQLPSGKVLLLGGEDRGALHTTGLLFA